MRLPGPCYPGTRDGGPIRTVPGGYKLILADPPWNFKLHNQKTGGNKHPSLHYNTMDLDDILALDVGMLAAKDSTLALWTTWPFIQQAFKVIDAWGFKYSGLCWEWIKYNSKTGRFFMSTGYGTRKNVEPCLLAHRGSPKIKARNVRDLIFYPRRESGRKPDIQYPLLEALYDGPYLELFSRTQYPGWHTWGNEKGTWVINKKLPFDPVIRL